MVGGQIVADRDSAHHTDLSLAALGNWTGLQYDFDWCCTVNINRTRDNIRSKDWWEVKMGAQIDVLVVWELASRSVYRRNP